MLPMIQYESLLSTSEYYAQASVKSQIQRTTHDSGDRQIAFRGSPGSPQCHTQEASIIPLATKLTFIQNNTDIPRVHMHEDATLR